MTWFRVGGGSGVPASLKSRMNAVLNKKFGTSGQNYPPKQWPDDVNLLGPLPEGTASGQIANFSDGADDVPTKSLVVTIPPTLSGVSALNETQTGRNLFDISTATNGQINGTNGVYYANANWQASDFFPVHGANLTLSWDTDSSNYYQVNLAFYDNAEHYVDGSNNAFANIYSKTFTIPNGAVYCRASWSISVGGSPAPRNNIRINLGSTDGGYTPYTSPTQYTASLGRTIYGGTADVVTGEGQETFGVFTFDGSDDEDWSYSNGRFKIAWPGTFEVFNTNHYRIRQCNNLAVDNVAAGSYELADNSVTWFTTNIIFIRKDDITSLENWKQYLLNNSLKIGGILATPESFTFTGQEVNSLYGVNNFWNDAGGDTTVVYRRDIDLALQAVSSSRGLMMASRPVTQLVGEESDPDQVNELVENNETEQEGEDNAR